MARGPRIELVGKYHIINRGVAQIGVGMSCHCHLTPLFYGDASTLDGWFTSASASAGPIEGTGMASNGNIVGYSFGYSYGLPATATVSQTYTVRIPLERSTSYQDRVSHMVQD